MSLSYDARGAKAGASTSMYQQAAGQDNFQALYDQLQQQLKQQARAEGYRR